MPANLSTPSIRPWRKTGIEFPCTVCGKIVYRRASQIARGITKTCGAAECKSVSMSGKNNPFWGKEHPKEVRERIKTGLKLAKAHRRKPGPPKGYKHTPEARALISQALRDRWKYNRDAMLSSIRRPHKPREQQRYRFCFTKWQRREWTESKCFWCDATDNLVLDHIIPVMCGGKNERKNAQTLCQPCNLWKMGHVDRQLFLAGLGNPRG